MSGYNHNYHMGLLEGRAKRLNELLAIAAPIDIILNEITLITESAKFFAPKPQWNYGSWGPQENEDLQSKLSQCATG